VVMHQELWTVCQDEAQRLRAHNEDNGLPKALVTISARERAARREKDNVYVFELALQARGTGKWNRNNGNFRGCSETSAAVQSVRKHQIGHEAYKTPFTCRGRDQKYHD